MENNQTAARAAKRFLSDRVRDDWDWPNTPECWSASDEEVRGVSEFRERYYGTTDPEFESDKEAESSASADPYQFDSPDSIGDDLLRKKQTRKRKRRLAQESEMEWNQGLSTFVSRRDVWTGAAAVKKYGVQQQTQPPTETSPSYLSIFGNGDVNANEAEATAILNPLIPAPTDSSSKNDPADPLIPLAPTLLHDNPIRASIKPKVYSDIYNNIVVVGRSPSVPVNLSDMTRALVHGWRENGEWPPKVGPLDPLAGGRKRSSAAANGNASGNTGDSGSPFLAHHPHVKKGMDSVKRIFHLNGHQHHHHEQQQQQHNGAAAAASSGNNG